MARPLPLPGFVGGMTDGRKRRLPGLTPRTNPLRALRNQLNGSKL